MGETKNWLCTICHRFGDETTLADAELRHRNMLHAAKYHNEVMSRTHPGWCGPSSTCSGRIVMSRKATVRRRRIRSEVFGEQAGDPWVEVGTRLKVSGKVVEKVETELKGEE